MESDRPKNPGRTAPIAPSIRAALGSRVATLTPVNAPSWSAHAWWQFMGGRRNEYLQLSPSLIASLSLYEGNARKRANNGRPDRDRRQESARSEAGVPAWCRDQHIGNLHRFPVWREGWEPGVVIPLIDNQIGVDSCVRHHTCT